MHGYETVKKVTSAYAMNFIFCTSVSYTIHSYTNISKDIRQFFDREVIKVDV